MKSRASIIRILQAYRQGIPAAGFFHEKSKAVSRTPQPIDKDLVWIDRIAELMDNRFRIPGTNIRFGFDFIVGLIPGVGDMVSMGISGILVLAMAKRGASGMLVVKMLGNVLIDALIGLVPFVGDLLDIGFMANRKNLRLLQEHYKYGRHRGSGWWVIAMAALLLIGVFALTIWLAAKISSAVLQWLF